MSTHVALLRGIGPGNPAMRNDALRSVFERDGFEGVRTVISSGNVLFDSDERDRAVLEDRIEAALGRHLGAHCTTIVRTRRQVTLLAGLDVFDDIDDSPSQRGNVTFLKRRMPSGRRVAGRRVAGRRVADEPGARVVGARNGAIFTVFDTTSERTPTLMRELERAYGPEITTRTWRTVHRIHAAMQDRT